MGADIGTLHRHTNTGMPSHEPEAALKLVRVVAAAVGLVGWWNQEETDQAETAWVCWVVVCGVGAGCVGWWCVVLGVCGVGGGANLLFDLCGEQLFDKHMEFEREKYRILAASLFDFWEKRIDKAYGV